ncbi:MAG: hypothetical protein ABI969_13125 [bacterium]
MKKLLAAAVFAGAVFAAACSETMPTAPNTLQPSFDRNQTPGSKISSSTTLDACGYFVGVQTANKTSVNGTLHSDNGTWSGVSNNYVNTPVASLGAVSGSYTDSYNLDPLTGYISNGSETFRSNAGTITQSFAFDATGWHVSVTATGSLSFLTSDTNGNCYTGPFPRP